MAPIDPDIEASVRSILRDLFPDRDTASIGVDDDLATALALDSMAMIDIALEVERRVGLHIPDEDLAALTSIGAVVRYVARRQ